MLIVLTKMYIYICVIFRILILILAQTEKVNTASKKAK